MAKNIWQEIKDRYPISSYLSEKGVEYQRKGKNLALKCVLPGHDDTKPSMVVFEDVRYTCFACTSNPQNRDLAQGDIFDLAALLEGIPRSEVLFFLAEKAKIDVDPQEAANIRRRFEETEKRKALMNRFMVNLSNQPAWLSYLQHKRGLALQTITYFGIGFDDASQHCSIPLRDQYGRLLAFTIHHPKADPKYKNPEDTELYAKSRFLFNLDSVKSALRDVNVLYIVEGYMDAISCWQADYKSAIATCSANLTRQQADAIKGVINPETRIVIIPDADATGARSVQNTFETLRSVCRNPVFVCLLHGKDAEGNSFVAKDANEWFATRKQTKLPDAINYFEYIVGFYQTEYPDEYIQAQKIREALKKAEKWEKTKLIKRLAQRWEFTDQQVADFLETQPEEVEVPYKDINFRIDEYVNYVRNLDTLRMSFGFKELDELLRGLNPGEIAALMGRANTCKTLMSTDMVDKMAALGKGVPTVLFSLEMPSTSITERMITQFLHVRTEGDLSPSKVIEEKVRDGDPETMEWLTKLRIAHHHLVIIDTPGLSVKDMERLLDYVEAHHFHEPVRMIVVDHLQIMRSEGATDYSRTTAAAKDLRDMTRRRQIGTIVLVQTSRKGGSGGDPVSMDDGRDSGAIEEVMDFIFGIWRPELKALAEMEKIRALPVHPSQRYLKSDGGKIMKDSGGSQMKETTEEAIQRARSDKARQISMMQRAALESRGLVYLQILKSRRENRMKLLVYRIAGLNLDFVRHGEQELLDGGSNDDTVGESSGIEPEGLDGDSKGVRLDG